MGDDERTNEQLVVAIQNEEDQHGQLILQLMQQNKGFFYKLCKPFIRSGAIDPDETPSFYFLAICGAVDAYGKDSASFLSHLKWATLKELLTATETYVPIRLGRNLLWEINRYNRELQTCLAHNREEPDAQEMSHRLGVPLKELEKIKRLRSLLQIQSLDAPIDSENAEDITLADTVASPEDVEKIVTGNVFHEALRNALYKELRRLPEEERRAIIDRYILGHKTDRALAERGLRILRQPASKSRLRAFLETRNLYRKTSIATFKYTMTAQPESLILMFEERGCSGNG